MMTDDDFTRLLRKAAHDLGFIVAGVCPAISPPGANRLTEWLTHGYAGEMGYFADRREAYDHPRGVMEGVRTLLMLALPYGPRDGETTKATVVSGHGKLARYARGPVDYHDVIHTRLKQLIAVAKAERPTMRARGVVDSAPLLEREFAQLAGFGWAGKNTLLLQRGLGSYFFLAALLTDQDLVCDAPFTADHCGSCRACLDACPTQAFPQPYVLDATRCISYLTIELRGPIPRELRSGIGEWLFGCDICQEVCPWNQKAATAHDPAFESRPDLDTVDVRGLFDLDDAAFRARFRATPLWRAKRRGILRNAAIVLGNQRDIASVPALVRALHDPEPLIRGAAAWALGEIGTVAAIDALRAQASTEDDSHVQEELTAALAGRRRDPP